MTTSYSVPSDSPLSLGRTALFSRIMAWLCALTAVGAVVFAVLSVLLIWNRPDPFLTREVQLALLAAYIASIGFLIWGLYHGRACFAGLARGDLFTRRTIAGLRNLALGMFLFKTAYFFLYVGMMLFADVLIADSASTLTPPPTSITVGDLAEGVFTLISLGAVVLIANVLTRAAEIAEDNAQIV